MVQARRIIKRIKGPFYIVALTLLILFGFYLYFYSEVDTYQSGFSTTLGPNWMPIETPEYTTVTYQPYQIPGLIVVTVGILALVLTIKFHSKLEY